MWRQIIIFASLLSIVFGATPALKVRACPNPLDWFNTTSIDSFTLDIGHGSPAQLTQVHICYDSNYINVRYDNVDNNIYSEYQNCNDDLFNEDVVEMFIAPVNENDLEAETYHYIEMEASPNGVLFVSNITNYSGDCGDFSGALIPCNASGVIVTAQRLDGENKWWAEIQVPFSLLAEMPPYQQIPQQQQTTFRANFFRIDQPNGQAREFSCWSPTFANPACFHKPAYFGTLQLV